MKVQVDRQLCQGHTLCAMLAPQSFELSDVDGHSSPIDEVVPERQHDRVREAVHSCPERAISIAE
ncbi:ferredoxin [Nocardia sp. NPDC055165]